MTENDNITPLDAHATRKIDVRWVTVKELERDEEGHYVAIARSIETATAHAALAVLLVSDKTFEIIHRMPDTDEGMSLAVFTAEVAESTLNARNFLLPEDAA